jgi:hypothetical protein
MGQRGESVELQYHDIVRTVSHIDGEDSTSLVERIGLLQAVKDELVSKTAPATGLSIAYTALVARDQRGETAASITGFHCNLRASLAEDAVPAISVGASGRHGAVAVCRRNAGGAPEIPDLWSATHGWTAMTRRS